MSVQFYGFHLQIVCSILKRCLIAVSTALLLSIVRMISKEHRFPRLTTSRLLQLDLSTDAVKFNLVSSRRTVGGK